MPPNKRLYKRQYFSPRNKPYGTFVIGKNFLDYFLIEKSTFYWENRYRFFMSRWKIIFLLLRRSTRWSSSCDAKWYRREYPSRCFEFGSSRGKPSKGHLHRRPDYHRTVVSPKLRFTGRLLTRCLPSRIDAVGGDIIRLQDYDYILKFGAGERIRTVDPNLGKVMLYP